VKIIEGVFGDDEKRQIVEDVTEAMVAIEGENMRGVTWVVVEEVHSGDWGIGGTPLRNQDVRALPPGRRPSREPGKRGAWPRMACAGSCLVRRGIGLPPGARGALRPLERLRSQLYSPTPIASTGRVRSARRVGSASATRASSAEPPRIAASGPAGT